VATSERPRVHASAIARARFKKGVCAGDLIDQADGLGFGGAEYVCAIDEIERSGWAH
jgi:hypothetical protein